MAVKSAFLVSILSLVLLSLLACSPASENDAVYQPFACLEGQSQCRVNTSIGSFSIDFNLARIRPEIPFDIALTYQGAHVIEQTSGYIEGINMYMGKIPLLAHKKQEQSKSGKERVIFNTQLGSCANPEMQWRAWFVVQYLDETKVERELRFSIDFPSYAM